jgi:hypothetical protein
VGNGRYSRPVVSAAVMLPAFNSCRTCPAGGKDCKHWELVLDDIARMRYKAGTRLEKAMPTADEIVPVEHLGNVPLRLKRRDC